MEPFPRSLLLEVYATNNKVGQLVERASTVAGISGEDFAFLSIVAIREPVTPTEISREFGLSLSTVLFRVQRNVDLGHVGRVANPQDGRSFHVALTTAGRLAWRRASNALRRLVTELERHLEVEPDEIRAGLLALQSAVDAELAVRR